MFSPLSEFLIYFCVGGLVHLVVLIAGIICATPLLFGRIRRYIRFVAWYSLFNVILILVSALMNSLWSFTVWGVAYYSMDYVTDFSPFWPITQGTIDAHFGGQRGALLNGMTLRGVQLLWLGFAVFTWIATAWIFIKTRKLIGKQASNKGLVLTGDPLRGSPAAQP